jgi:hypothetical protein
MAESFDTVDEKTAEAEFFLSKMCDSGFAVFEFQCYFSAFLAATRTITLALQRFKDIPGFPEWYEVHRERLAGDPLAKYFLKLRNDHAHGGGYPVRGAMITGGQVTYFFPKSDKKQALDPSITNDIVAASRGYFIHLLGIVYDCYVQLGPHIDPQQYYTKEQYLGGIDSAECEIFGWVKTSLIDEGYTEDDRWHELRAYIGECKINHLFNGYLQKVTLQPVLPEDFYDFEPSEEDNGWNHIPAGFSSIEDYIDSIRGGQTLDKSST